jgi:hypothetical protein
MWRTDSSSSASRRFLVAAALLVAACGDAPSAAPPTPRVASAVPVAAPAPRAAPPASRANDSSADAVATPRVVRPIVALLPSDDADVTRDLAAGLRAAFDDARRAGGPDLELRVAAASERWGSQVEEAVRIAVDDGAVALVAPPERRHAHLLAQLATKVKVPMLSTARDPRVAAAGSSWVVPVAPPLTLDEARRIDGLPPPPTFDPPEARPWERVGRDAGRRVVDAVRAHGLRREALVESIRADAVR